MERIGLTASKIAQGNVWLYNLAVIWISLLFGVFVFLVCSFVIAVAIFAVSFLVQLFLPATDQLTWLRVLRTCIWLLVGVISLVTIAAMIKNFKFRA